MAKSITLEVFTDYVCPWCYLGDNRVKQLKRDYDIKIEFVHFPLHPETPSEGKSLADLFGRGPEELHRLCSIGITIVDRCNVGDVEVIVDIAKSAGLDEAEARAVLAERRFKDAVDADWAKSRAYGVTGVPTFMTGGQGVVGAQPYEVLEQLMASVGAEKRTG